MDCAYQQPTHASTLHPSLHDLFCSVQCAVCTPKFMAVDRCFRPLVSVHLSCRVLWPPWLLPPGTTRDHSQRTTATGPCKSCAQLAGTARAVCPCRARRGPMGLSWGCRHRRVVACVQQGTSAPCSPLPPSRWSAVVWECTVRPAAWLLWPPCLASTPWAPVSPPALPSCDAPVATTASVALEYCAPRDASVVPIA
jgi:hypothetical protein